MRTEARKHIRAEVPDWKLVMYKALTERMDTLRAQHREVTQFMDDYIGKGYEDWIAELVAEECKEELSEIERVFKKLARRRTSIEKGTLQKEEERFEDLIERAKGVSLETIFTPRRYSSHGYVAICPFHEDHTPSLVCYTKGDNPNFHCYVCGAHGDVIRGVMRLQGISFKEAVKYLN